jgi:hypothetical protein
VACYLGSKKKKKIIPKGFSSLLKIHLFFNKSKDNFLFNPAWKWLKSLVDYMELNYDMISYYNNIIPILHP